MLDHFGINCRDIAASAAFYDRVLGVLGHRRLMDYEVAIGYGTEKPDFWISAWQDDTSPTARSTSRSRPRTRRRCGRSTPPRSSWEPRSSHAPRVWPEYHPGYYGAFVRDPDGNNVEAVCHTAPEG